MQGLLNVLAATIAMIGGIFALWWVITPKRLPARRQRRGAIALVFCIVSAVVYAISGGLN